MTKLAKPEVNAEELLHEMFRIKNLLREKCCLSFKFK